ncbi:hypothetical protein, partial [Cryobacterium sp. Y62]|uniref:hypothetical protein n=1 Tax=Cryobacterium sp. Y62 TaxID=2048284 RepID=UPI001E2F0064
ARPLDRHTMPLTGLNVPLVPNRPGFQAAIMLAASSLIGQFDLVFLGPDVPRSRLLLYQSTLSKERTSTSARVFSGPVAKGEFFEAEARSGAAKTLSECST